MVLNSLAGEMMDASFRAVAQGGRFVEIGKRGLKGQAWVKALGRDIAYDVIDWGETARGSRTSSAASCAAWPDAADELPPLPRKRLLRRRRRPPSASWPRRAMRARSWCAVRRPHTVRTDGTYLVTGGLSGLGLETARWLANTGRAGWC